MPGVNAPSRRTVLLSIAVAVLALVAGTTAYVLVGNGVRTPDAQGSLGATPSSSAGQPTATATATPGPTTTKPACPGPWGCEQQARFTAAKTLLKKQPGRMGVVVIDRRTGASWRAGATTARYWAGSTPKLAMAVALLTEARAGAVALDDTARDNIAAMLSVSDNDAADAIWDGFGSSAEWLTRMHRYGMTSATYLNGFPKRWGFVRTNPEDLARTVRYVLEKTHPDDRAYLVKAMRTVGSVQRWGVWGAGPGQHPGVKNGWSVEKEHGRDLWITATAGFAGPDERYIVAAMYHQPPVTGSIDHGVHALTDLVATIFGAPVPAPAVIPKDY
jgi:hypothetical protein